MKIRRDTFGRWDSIVMETDLLRVVVLPDHGAEIVSIKHLPTGTETMYQAPWGRPGPSDPPLPGSEDIPFLHRYAGGWQELFPFIGVPPDNLGSVPLDYHGEAATAPWEVAIEKGSVVVSFSSSCLPLTLHRRMSIDPGHPALQVEERVVNTGKVGTHFTWGHHPLLGPPFLEAGCRIHLTASRGQVPEQYEDAYRLAPRTAFEWPYAVARHGGQIDLRIVPGPEEKSHDDVQLTDLRDGRISVRNPRLGLEFALVFEQTVFPWVILWQPFGGNVSPPLTNAFGLGIEPWSSPLPLDEAISSGSATFLDPGIAIETTLEARISDFAEQDD